MSLTDDLAALEQAGARLRLRACQIQRVRHPLSRETVEGLRAESAALRVALDRLDAALAPLAPIDPGLCHTWEGTTEDWAAYHHGLTLERTKQRKEVGACD